MVEALNAAKLVWRHWHAGTRMDGLPGDSRPQSMTEGYAVQAHLPALAGDDVVGWKIAATNPSGQAHIGVDGPIAGRLLASRVLKSPATLSMANNQMRVAEAEIAFNMATDLTPRETAYSIDEVMRAVDYVRAAIEVPDSRFNAFESVGAEQLAADNACAHWLILGAPAPASALQADFPRHVVRLSVNDTVVVEGRGADVLGDPRAALTWIANNASLQGDYLRAGQVVTTGVCGRPAPVAPGDKVMADLGLLGRVALDIRD